MPLWTDIQGNIQPSGFVRDSINGYTAIFEGVVTDYTSSSPRTIDLSSWIPKDGKAYMVCSRFHSTKIKKKNKP